ncbi:enoyl-CoA hydratase-related protein, partial [Nocardioides pelophilus]|uniref:enoyl-CoA hydratase-related protein n=1 Tax=Nocardioides pelophilus TaxID=2172019 RepID=UPI001602D81B
MADTSPELVHYDVADRIATITLDSPHNRNALSRQLVTELFERLDRADQDADVLAVVLRSSGRVFCSGADLTEASTTPMEEGARAIVRLQRAIVALSKPVVTVVAGAARAGGIGIVAASDIVLTAEDATFALTEVKLGLTPAVISLTVLPRLTPRAAALTALGGEVFTGSEAVDYGLATRAVPAGQLDAAVAELCAQL